jgi:hypothetical protein
MHMRTLCAAATVAVIVAALGGPPARAETVGPYQVEAEGRYMNMSEDSVEFSMFGAGGLYAFESVDPGTGPLEESLFLARVPSAGAMLGLASFEIDLGVPAELDGLMFGLMGGYADKDVPVGVDLEFNTADLDGDVAGTTVTLEMSELDLEVGYFVLPNLRVGIAYEKEEMEISAPGSGTFKDEASGFGVAGKWVEDLGDGMAVNVEAGYSSLTMDDGTVERDGSLIRIGGDFYFTQLVGVGFGLELISGDQPSDDATTFEIRFSWNQNTNFGAGVSWERTSYDEPGSDDVDTFTLSAVGRF